MSPRVYVRKFDYDEARQRYADGEHPRDLAAEYGVSMNRVRQVVIPEEGQRAAERARQWIYSGTCPICGGPATRTGGQSRCRECFNVAQATSVRPDELRCPTCGEWKPDEDFPFNAGGRKLRRGRHQSCRPCLTKLRQNYRERHKVPCVVCGKPALPPSEKRTSGAPFPRCRECYDEERSARRQVRRRVAA